MDKSSAPGRVRLRLKTNAKKVQVRYISVSGGVKKKTKKMRRGRAVVTLPVGADHVYARALRTSKVRSTPWTPVPDASPWLYFKERDTSGYGDAAMSYIRAQVIGEALVLDFPLSVDLRPAYREHLGTDGCIVAAHFQPGDRGYGSVSPTTDWKFEDWEYYEAYARTFTQSVPSKVYITFQRPHYSGSATVTVWEKAFDPTTQETANAWMAAVRSAMGRGWACP